VARVGLQVDARSAARRPGARRSARARVADFAARARVTARPAIRGIARDVRAHRRRSARRLTRRAHRATGATVATRPGRAGVAARTAVRAIARHVDAAASARHEPCAASSIDRGRVGYDVARCIRRSIAERVDAGVERNEAVCTGRIVNATDARGEHCSEHEQPEGANGEHGFILSAFESRPEGGPDGGFS
jgi:hypothetical protein